MIISIILSLLIISTIYIAATYNIRCKDLKYRKDITKELNKEEVEEYESNLAGAELGLIVVTVIFFIGFLIFTSIEYFLYMFLPRFLIFLIIFSIITVFMFLRLKKQISSKITVLNRIENIENKMEIIKEVKSIISDRRNKLYTIIPEKRDEQDAVLKEAYKMFEEIEADLYNSLSMVKMNYKIAELGDIIIPESSLELLQNHVDKIKAQKSLSQISSDLDDVMKKYDITK